MVGLAIHDRAPYKNVLTHGWTLDAQGKAMHKSAGNAVAPEEVIKDSGAEILRLWSASSNYFEDMRCSAEILQRVTDGYRKLRNTARFALGNLSGFDPSRDVVADEALLEIDRWALAKLDEVIGKVRTAYDNYEFHLVYHLLSDFCTVTLSARYFDIIKDRLYTFAPRNQARRSAQTALFRIADALARMLAPILVFTADEIWESLPQDSSRASSVHLALLPEPQGVLDPGLVPRWEAIFKVREEVLRELEAQRVAKVIGSSLDAKVKLSVSWEIYDLLKPYQDNNELRYLFIVSQTELVQADLRPVDRVSTGTTPLISVEVERAEGQKCERCWNYSTHVGESAKYPTVCERCVVALEEIEKEEA
jgi:isoleucyl-tRNA synthetase